ncbi:hypoxia inducible factor 1 subunit alpha, like [Polymixia lowei]
MPTELDLLGQSVYEFVHPCDQEELRDLLAPRPGVSMKQTGRNFFLRVKSTLTTRGRTVNIKSATWKVLHCTGYTRVFSSSSGDSTSPPVGSVMTLLCEPIPHPSSVEFPLDRSTFLTRHSMDLLFTHCEGRVTELVGYELDDLIGRSAYEFHHALDSHHVNKSLHTLLSKGQVCTSHYRFLAKSGGFVWALTQATVLYNNKTSQPEAVVCLNFILSFVEQPDVVFSVEQTGCGLTTEPCGTHPDTKTLAEPCGTHPDTKTLAEPCGTHPDTKTLAEPCGTHPDTKTLAEPCGTHPDTKTLAEPCGTHPDRKTLAEPCGTHPDRKTLAEPCGTYPERKTLAEPCGTHPDRKTLAEPCGTHPDRKTLAGSPQREEVVLRPGSSVELFLQLKENPEDLLQLAPESGDTIVPLTDFVELSFASPPSPSSVPESPQDLCTPELRQLLSPIFNTVTSPSSSPSSSEPDPAVTPSKEETDPDQVEKFFAVCPEDRKTLQGVEVMDLDMLAPYISMDDDFQLTFLSSLPEGSDLPSSSSEPPTAMRPATLSRKRSHDPDKGVSQIQDKRQRYAPSCIEQELLLSQRLLGCLEETDQSDLEIEPRPRRWSQLLTDRDPVLGGVQGLCDTAEIFMSRPPDLSPLSHLT